MTRGDPALPVWTETSCDDTGSIRGATDMAETLKYKGYQIRLTPQQLAESKRWTLRLWIENHTGPEVFEKLFSGNATFGSADEAARAGVEFGMRIVDGEVEGIHAPGP